MNKNRFLLLLLLSIFISFAACSSSKDDPIEPTTDPPTQPEAPITLANGMVVNISPNADSPLTITYTIPSGSELYNYNGDVYAHTGAIDDGSWQINGKDIVWGDNASKFKMTKGKDNVYSITISPNLRQWYGSGTTPINKLGFVFRNSNGSKQTRPDLFIDVTDDKYQAFVPSDAVKAPVPSGLKEGINIINSSTVSLVLYDKDNTGNHKDYALVVGDFNNWKLSNDDNCKMKRDDTNGCWWITLSNLDSNKEYAFQYYLGNKGKDAIRIADPYCEKILDPANDKYIPTSTYSDNKNYPTGAKGIVSVFKIAKDNYSWSNKDFKIANQKSLVIYELCLRDFTTSRDITGAESKLDYLKSLGINAIELMPVQEFDGNDSWGYNPCFYFALDKAYGTKKMYKDFIDKCHQKGIAVLFDVVYNHATENMPFVKLYWDNKNKQVSSSSPYFNIKAPHPFSVFIDFNHESSQVRKFFKRNLEFLLDEYHIDGFRFDLSKGFTQKSSSDDNAFRKYDANRIAILKDYYTTIKQTNPNAVMILEHFCDNSEEQELANAGMYLWRNMNNSYCQTAMGYSENSSFDGMYTSTPSWVGYMESHDEERMGYKQIKWGVTSIQSSLKTRISQLEANTAFFLTLPGPKMIWEFGELGYDYSIQSNEAGTSVDDSFKTGRKPIVWNYAEDSNRKELLNLYSRLAALRNQYPEIFNGNSTVQMKTNVSDWNNGRYIYIKSTTGKEIVVLGNFTDSNTEVSFPAKIGNWKDYILGKDEAVQSKVNIPAHNFKIFTRL